MNTGGFVKRWRCGKYVMGLLTVLTLHITSCGEGGDTILTADHKYSATQRHLIQLLEDYKVEYNAAKIASERDSVYLKYHRLTEQFLIDTLQRFIDSMTVTVDTVIQEGWLVTTVFS